MPKRKTPLQTIVQFFMTAEAAVVETAQDAIRGVLGGRTDLKPVATTGKKRGRKPRQPDLPVDEG